MLKTELRRIYLKNYRFKKNKILGRVACLGTDILKILDFERGLNNFQKCRVDYLLDVESNPSHKPKSKTVCGFLAKKYISDCILQQENSFFNCRRPSFIFIDSFSELTDQLFVNKTDRRRFLANYSDLDHSEAFKKEYDCLGLLDIESFRSYYEIFFKRLSLIYNDVPVFYVHFPTILDNRELFKVRGEAIVNIIDDLSGNSDLLHSIRVNDTLVSPSKDQSDEMRNFPYHFDKSTYHAFADQISAIIFREGYLK